MFRVVGSALICTAAAIGLATAPALADEKKDEEMSKGEMKLAKMLDGREAGEPTSCITTFGSQSLQVIDKTAIVYKSGDTVWVNRTRHPQSLDDDDYLVIRKYGSGSRLCKLDNVTTYDRGSNFFSGVVFLDDFVPYRKAADDKG